MRNVSMTVNGKSVDDSYLSTFSPIEVVIGNGGRIEDAIHRFRALVTKEQVMSSLKLHYEYEKPSIKKRRKSREAIQRNKKLNAAAASKKAGQHNQQKTKSSQQQLSDDGFDDNDNG